MKIILLLLKSSRKNLFFTIMASLISGICSAGVIAIINYVITNLQGLPTWFPWLFIALCLILFIFSYISWVLTTRLSQSIIYEMRLKMTQQILDCPLQHLEAVGASKLLAMLTRDINSISGASINVSLIFVNLSVLVGIFAYLCWLSPLLFLMVFMSVVVGFSLYSFIQQKGIKNFELNRQVQDDLLSNFRSVTEGTKELKLHRPRRNAFLHEELKVNAAKSKYYWNKAISIIAFGFSLGKVLFFVPIGLILFVFPRISSISTETISSYAIAVLYIINPITNLATSLPQLSEANVAIDKIESLGLSLSETGNEPNFPTGSNFSDDWTSLELVKINHAYRRESEEHQFSLQNIDLQFKPGEIVFIVGGNGSGKSTLVKLITGLYTCDSGEILFNNLPVTDDNREWYRQKFSVIFYDFHLFDRLIGISDNQQREVQNYLKLLEIDHKVTVTDGTLSTTNLSQGQRKRLALLTAYLEDRPIYVFDEWASDQDPIFKKIFYEKLVPELKSRGKTVIAITHDDQYFEYCDRLIKLDYGSLINDN